MVNNLSAINKSWLHITDNEHFIEKLDDITCPHTDFDPFGIVNLAETLNLSPFYLTEFSNATYDKTTTPLDNFQLFEDIKTYEEQQNNFTILEEGKEPFGTNSIEGTTDNNNFPNKSAQLAFETNEKIMPLKGYSEQIINAVWGNNEMKVNIMCYDNFCLAFPLLAPKINQEHLVIVEGDYTEEERLHLQRFLKKEVFIISEKMFGWQMGEYKGSTKNAMATVTPVQQVQITPLDFPIVYSLPQWVDDLIFDELKAEYAPDHIRFEYNLNLDSKEVLTYLGTYFPRSYAEVYHLFSKLLFAKEQKTFMGEKNTLNILDLGCGTGGEILGLLNYIREMATNV